MSDSNHNLTPLLLSTAYCAPAAYFSLIAKSENQEVRIEQMETYPKQTWRNRCTILTSQGTLDLTIPVKKPFGNHTKTHEIEIDNENQWYLNHWKALTAAYNASPFFMYYQDELEPFYKGNYTNLIDFNIQLTTILLKILRIEIKTSLTTDFKILDTEKDLRYQLTPKKTINESKFPSYIQVFSENGQFYPNLSILDILFNLGPESTGYLKSIKDLDLS